MKNWTAPFWVPSRSFEAKLLLILNVSLYVLAGFWAPALNNVLMP